MKTIIHTPAAPEPIGPYSQGVKAGNTFYLSGQIALNPESGALVLESLAAETHMVMKNIGAVLQSQGLTFSHIVKTSIFLKNMDDFGEVNSIYGSYFESDFPARETVQVARLPKDVNVEISVIAVQA